MKDLSILIPARNERFLYRTIEDILLNIEADTEVIAVLDGQLADPPIPQNDRVNVIYLPKSAGQRAATNLACKLSKAKYVMKCDAHCAFDKGFDRKMLEAFKKTGDSVTMVPIMRNLWAFDWKCHHCGFRKYQGPTPLKCDKCGATDKIRRKMVWFGKPNPQSASYCFDSTPHFQYFNDWKNRPQYIKEKQEKGLTETMSLQGSCWMLTKDKYFELNICDENFGSWGSQGIEVAVKTWLSGGTVLVNHNTWYAHMFRTQGGDFGFPYPMSGSDQDKAKKTAHDLFFNNKWDKQIYPLSWLVEKFWPVKGWTEKEFEELKANTFEFSPQIANINPAESEPTEESIGVKGVAEIKDENEVKGSTETDDNPDKFIVSTEETENKQEATIPTLIEPELTAAPSEKTVAPSEKAIFIPADLPIIDNLANVAELKVTIIGYGWVGKSVHKLFPDAFLYDPPRYKSQRKANKGDVAFICVPTPSIGEGRLDTSIVEECVAWCECPLIVIRSTVNPGTCDYLSMKYNKRIIVQPEYLGETPQHPLLDEKNTPFIVIGGHPQDRRILINLYTSVYNANVKIRQVTAYEAEVVKLSENRAISFKVAECQELYDVCEGAGIDYYTIRDIVYGDDPRFNLWWTFIYPDKRGFNSKCIPKDVYAWCAWAESLGIKPEITRNLLEVNKKWLSTEPTETKEKIDTNFFNVDTKTEAESKTKIAGLTEEIAPDLKAKPK